MSGTSADDFFSRQVREARGPEAEHSAKRRKKRSKLLKRVILASALSLAVLVGVVAVGGYVAVNHIASSIKRIPGIVALDAAHQPVMPATTRHSITVLLTSSGLFPGSSMSPSGLIALVHLNADRHGGAVVSIPANAVVDVPGIGTMELWNALRLGGASLLIKTVERLTNTRIDHYSVMDFAGARGVVGAMNGVNVRVPFTVTSDGFTFHAGINHLTSASVLPYVRQAGVSQVTRTELQGNLIRAILSKIARDRMFVGTDWRVLHAMAAALSVDSNFSNSELTSLALRLGHLQGRDGTFITAPTTAGSGGAVYLIKRITRRLWLAIRHDSVARFAQQYPFTVTPGAPG